MTDQPISSVPDTAKASQLLTAAKKGSEDALEELMVIYSSTVSRVVCWPKWHFKTETRKDVEQEINQSLIKSILSATTGQSLTAFVKRICINRCIDEVRHQVRSRGLFVSMPSMTSDSGESLEVPLPDVTAPDPIDMITHDEQLSTLRQSLAKLNDTCREAIHLFYIKNKSYKEIAHEKGLAVNTVGSRLAKCLSKLKEMATSKE